MDGKAAGTYDIAVIGGGISGLGAAWVAATLGQKAVLFEARDLAQEVSANSLRIIHGGFRYLQTLDFSRVRESVVEQQWMLAHFPALVRPLRCLMPLERWGTRSRFPLRCASYLYTQLAHAAGYVPRAPRLLTAKEAHAALPAAESLFRRGALEWYDALLLDPAKLAREIAASIQALGGEVRTNSRVREVQPVGSKQRIVLESGEAVLASTAVDTTPDASVPRCLGFNVLLTHSLSAEVALGFRSRRGRMFFLVPRDDGAALGTEYMWSDNGIPGQDRVESFLAEAREAFPWEGFSARNVYGLDTGFLPSTSSAAEAPEPLTHPVIRRNGTLTRLQAVKYTTFRSVAHTTLRGIRAARESPGASE